MDDMQITITTLGWMAAFVTMIMNAPTTFKVIKHKNADGLPLLSYSILTFAFLTFLFWSAQLGVKEGIQMYCTNAIGIVLVLPLLWYRIKSKKTASIVIAIILMIAVTATVLFALRTMEGYYDGFGNFLSILLPTLSGVGIGFAFFPQTISSIESKHVGVPTMSIVLLMLSSTLWFTWALISFIDFGFASYAISMIFNMFGVIMQIPLLYLKLSKGSGK